MGTTSMSSVILIPSWAKVLSGEGYTKQMVKDYIAQHSKPVVISGFETITNPDKMDTENLMILVAGGPGSFIGLLKSVGPGFFNNALVTKKIVLPKDWNKLVAKYSNLVPVYERY
jgi:hypothetical protein